jgi:hypothetical protein
MNKYLKESETKRILSNPLTMLVIFIYLILIVVVIPIIYIWKN